MSGFRQQETVTNSLATTVYELQRDNLGQLKTEDQQVIESEMAESVDTVRFIKTNRPFYKKIVLLWLKFRAAHFSRILQNQNLTDEFAKFAAAKLNLAPSH